MNWIDKLNRWALSHIRPHAVQKVETNHEGVTLIRQDGNQFFRWSDIQEIAVLQQPALSTGSFALAIRESDSKLAILDDTISGYSQFCEQLPQRLPGVTPYQQWAVELIADPTKPGTVIFRRAAAFPNLRSDT